MKNKIGVKTLVIALCLCAVCVIGIGTAAALRGRDAPKPMEELSPEAFYQWGQLEREYADQKPDPAVYYQGNQITIRVQDMEKGIREQVLFGRIREESEKQTLDELLRREALYTEAIRLGYSVTREEIRAQIENEKSMMNEAEDTGKDRFLEFLKGAQMTVDEYFDLQWDLREKELVIDRYLSDINAEFSEKNQRQDAKESDALWEAEIQKKVDAIVRADRGKVIRPLA